MLEQIETIVMWAEYGDALFWHKGKGCCGDSRSVITDSGKVINLNGIRGLKEWYARFDDDKYPAYEWSPEEYIAWKKEGVKSPPGREDTLVCAGWRYRFSSASPKHTTNLPKSSIFWHFLNNALQANQKGAPHLTGHGASHVCKLKI